MTEISVEWMNEQRRILVLTMPEIWTVDDLMGGVRISTGKGLKPLRKVC